MRLVFLGTPAFAVPSLERLVEAGHRVLAVYTQPDRPKGRGGTPTPSPVKQTALRLGLEVRQPERIRRPEIAVELAALETDAMVVVGYGQIIPRTIIDLPRHGIVNVHASLLPKYRGAAPVQWAVANGETVTGVTTMRIDAGLDTGAMLLRWETPIGAEETSVELSERLAAAGAELLIRTLDGIERDTIVPEPQDNTQATYAPILKKEDGRLEWSWPAEKLAARVRGLQPWPGAYTAFRGQLLHILKARPAEPVDAQPGEIRERDRRLIVACGGNTALELMEVRMEGRRSMTAEAFANGARIEENERLGA